MRLLGIAAVTLHLWLAALSIGAVSQPDAAIAYVMDYLEGGATLVLNDASAGMTRWGINQAAHPQVDIAHLTRAEAMRIYRRDYWDALRIGSYPPSMRFLIFDTAVNVGQGRVKAWLSRISGPDDAAGLLRLRAQWHRQLAAAPRFQPFRVIWYIRDVVAAVAAALPIDMAG